MDKELEKIQKMINNYKEASPEASVGELSDTYHTFNELYKHRTVLTAMICTMIPYAWKSRKHEDGTMYEGMFICGFPTPSGMITYHYDMNDWGLFRVQEIPHAPHFDGHTPNDVIDRIIDYINAFQSRVLPKEDIMKIMNIVKTELAPTMSPIEFARFVSINSFS